MKLEENTVFNLKKNRQAVLKALASSQDPLKISLLKTQLKQIDFMIQQKMRTLKTK